MLFGIIKLIILFAVIIFFAWQFLYRVLAQKEIYVLIGASLATGILSYTIILNALAYLVGIDLSFYLAVLLLAIVALVLYLLPGEKLELGMEKRYLFYLAGMVTLAILFFAPIFYVNEPFDEAWHGPLIATIANGNFPVMKIELPGSYVQYHYAFDIYAAALSVVGGVSVINASMIAMLSLVLSVLLLGFTFFYKISRNIFSSFFGIFLLFFGAGFRYLTVITDLSWGKHKYLIDYVREGSNLLMSAIPMSPGYFHGYSVDALAVNMYHRPTLYSVVTILMVLFLAFLEQRHETLRYKIILALFLGFLALSAETSFLIVACAWGLWRLFFMIKDKENIKKTIMSIVTVALIACGVAIFQGGIITDTVLHKETGSDIMPEYSQFQLRFLPLLVSYDQIFSFSQIRTWFFLFVEWGLPLLLFPFIAWNYFRNKCKDYLLFIFIAFIAMLVTLFVHYPEKPGEMTRVNFISLMFMSLVLGIYLGELWLKRNYRFVIILILVGVSLSPILFNLRAFPVRLEARAMYLETVEFEKEKEIAVWARQNLPEQAGVVTASPRMVNQLWGRLTFYGADAHDNRWLPTALPRLIEKNDLEYIKSRNADYIYDNPIFRESGAGLIVDDNLNRLELIYENGPEYRIYKIK
jgi:hypothetical protein